MTAPEPRKTLRLTPRKAPGTPTADAATKPQRAPSTPARKTQGSTPRPSSQAAPPSKRSAGTDKPGATKRPKAPSTQRQGAARSPQPAPPRPAQPNAGGSARGAAAQPARRAPPARATTDAQPKARATRAAEGNRLAKRVAALVPCSRAEAEQYIEGGWVTVDGKVVEEPAVRVQHQTVAINPDATLVAQPPVTLLLNKPADWVDGTEESLAKLNRDARRAGFHDARALLDTAHHVARDPSGIRLLQRHFKQLSPMVPLENAASGLVVFTQDWRVARKLGEEAHTLEHEVMVVVQGTVNAATLQRLRRSVESDTHMPLVKVSLSSATPARSTLRFAIKGAHRGLIAHLCERAQLEILEMHRIRLGRVGLRELPTGQWRYLTPGERF